MYRAGGPPRFASMAGWLQKLLGPFRRKAAVGDDITEEWVSLLDRVGADMAARKRALKPLAAVVGAISRTLYEADPVWLREGGAPEDEYDSEAETIVMRLSDRRELVGVDQVRLIVHEEFVRWFGETTAGAEDRYGDVAVDVHRLWQEFLASGNA